VQPQVTKEVDYTLNYEAILAIGIPHTKLCKSSLKITLAKEVENGSQIARQFCINNKAILL